MTDTVNHPLPSRGEFMGWVDIQPDTGCWEWNLSRNNRRGGYGQKRVGSKNHKAHRLAWMVFIGPIEPGMFVCHKCDNPPCCNPEHLFIGSPRDNTIDAMKKGRAFVPVSQRGEKSPASKLSAIDVREARRRIAEGWSLAEVAGQFDVTKQAIWLIKEGRTWETI